MIVENANAKINLFLDVVSRRSDGFHDIVTVMRSVSLSDTLKIEAERADKVEIVIDTDSKLLPNDAANLVYKAALAYLSSFGIMARVNVRLEKRIPIGAGLGGGSADAAATLRAMNRIFGLATEQELLTLAARIGSDVPFCLNGKAALCEGKGEIITPIPKSEKLYLAIAIGDNRISTPLAYALLDEKYSCFIGYSPRELDREKLLTEGRLTETYNIFESITDFPDIERIKSIMLSHGANGAMMSGSGPAVFGLFSDVNSAARTVERLVEAGFTAFFAETE